MQTSQWKQKGSDHYKTGGIQPFEYIAANDLNYWEGNIVKYVTRWRRKGTPIEDLNKLIHYAEYLKETYKDAGPTNRVCKEPITKRSTSKGNKWFSWVRRLFKRKGSNSSRAYRDAFDRAIRSSS